MSNEDIVVEWAPFRVRPGVTTEALIAASDQLHADFLARQPGFVARELLRGPDEQWTDLVFWENRATAAAAMQRVADSPACGRYFALMEVADHGDGGASALLLGRVKRYARAAT